MRKARSGKLYFEALGRAARSLGFSSISERSMRLSWPKWAREAYARGWLLQQHGSQP